jgi:hypothetical protein
VNGRDNLGLSKIAPGEESMLAAASRQCLAAVQQRAMAPGKDGADCSTAMGLGPALRRQKGLADASDWPFWQVGVSAQ